MVNAFRMYTHADGTHRLVTRSLTWLMIGTVCEPHVHTEPLSSTVCCNLDGHCVCVRSCVKLRHVITPDNRLITPDTCANEAGVWCRLQNLIKMKLRPVLWGWPFGIAILPSVYKPYVCT